MKPVAPLLALFAVLSWPAQRLPTPTTGVQNTRIEYYALSGMPIQVNALSVKNRTVMTELEYSVTNLSEDDLERIQFKLYQFDSRGKFKHVEDLTENIRLKARSVKTSSFDLVNNYEANDQLVLVTQELVGLSGRWFVAPSRVDAAIKSKFTNRIDFPLEVRHEFNLILTEADKAEIFSATFKEALKNEPLAPLFNHSKRLNISTENIPPSLRIKIQEPGLLFLTPLEIRTRANQVGEIRYVQVEPLEVEGSKVILTLNVHTRARDNQVIDPCCGSFIFEYYKNPVSGEWSVREIKSYP